MNCQLKYENLHSLSTCTRVTPFAVCESRQGGASTKFPLQLCVLHNNSSSVEILQRYGLSVDNKLLMPTYTDINLTNFFYTRLAIFLSRIIFLFVKIEQRCRTYSFTLSYSYALLKSHKNFHSDRSGAE